jgi:hypothetical protein
MTPWRMALRRTFSPTSFTLMKEKALKAAVRLGLAREPPRRYATPGV